MTKLTPTFNISDFELRDYTSPWLTPAQAADVTLTEDRVDEQLNFLAQMLGWNGPNYWGSLASTPSQKRQLLSGTFGVYNSFVIPQVYEIRNWNDTLVIDRLQFLEPGRANQVARIVVGDTTYRLRSVEVEGDKYVVSIGELTQEFFNSVQNNVPIQVDFPTYRSSPFERSKIGASGDYSFVCGNTDGELTLYPGFDTKKQFPIKFPLIFSGAVYYFDRPVYLATSNSLVPEISPSYDPEKELWFFEIPSSLTSSVGITAYLAEANTSPTLTNNYSLQVTILPWVDPSDWKSLNVLRNFRGTWGNKGGDLPFNFVFDSLSIHGFDEKSSVYLPPVNKELNFNDIVNFVYYQKTVVSDLAPGSPNVGDIWWNDETGALAVWLPGDSGCGSWVEIDYRQSPRQTPAPEVTYPDVTSFQTGSGLLPVGTVVRIEDFTGLSIADNVLGVQGTLSGAGSLVLHKDSSSPYWTPDNFTYPTVSDFELDAELLPFKVPVTIANASGLEPTSTNYSITNLSINVSGDYEVLLVKYYTNTTWEIFPDSILKFIAYSSLFGGPLQGEMWWDFLNSDPNTRAAAMYYESAWVGLNTHPQSGPPAPTLDLGVVLFYCNGALLTDGVSFVSDDFQFKYVSSPTTGKYEFTYTPITLKGKTQLPTITVSDSITTVYQADISDLVFSGITYYMSPNVYNAESPLRLWKSQDLQVAETVSHLEEGNYINPFLADVNNGPGLENWERYFVRMPLDYGRDESVWQKVTLTCQNFAYWGSTTNPEKMECPPEDDLPAIYEELFLYDQPVADYTYVYCEPYLYSNIAYADTAETGQFQNSGIFPTIDEPFDDFSEAQLVTYDPLHNRQADVTSPVGGGYGDWLGDYVNINPCIPLSGFFTTDLVEGGIEPVAPPVWDASIYKFAPTCENNAASYEVDANHYKIGYAYFVADASAAEDAFFDISKEASWRYPVDQPKTLYLTPR
jgi:hypothetical protein